MALYDLEDVFRMAAQLEESGRAFYETVALNSPNVVVAALCRDLAQQEQMHFETFDAMRRGATGKGRPAEATFGQMQVTQALLEDKAAPMQEEARSVAEHGSLEDILDMAIAMEAKSVAFYLEIASAVDGEDADTIGRVIEEEGRHEEMLQEVKAAL